MPSPIAHLGAGYAIYRLYRHKMPMDDRHLWGVALQPAVVAGLSMLPDLDIIPAIIFRDMENYHNNFSHSLLIAVPAAFLVAGIMQRTYRSNFWLWFLIGLVSYDVHIIMDYLTGDRGVMMFWPLTQARYTSPVKVFYGLQWGLGWVSIWHLWTILTETLFAVVAIGAINYFDRRRKQTYKRISRET